VESHVALRVFRQVFAAVLDVVERPFPATAVPGEVAFLSEKLRGWLETTVVCEVRCDKYLELSPALFYHVERVVTVDKDVVESQSVH
jgi:hypothetical protein